MSLTSKVNLVGVRIPNSSPSNWIDVINETNRGILKTSTFRDVNKMEIEIKIDGQNIFDMDNIYDYEDMLGGYIGVTPENNSLKVTPNGVAQGTNKFVLIFNAPFQSLSVRVRKTTTGSGYWVVMYGYNYVVEV